MIKNNGTSAASSYLMGFLLSVTLTLAAFIAVAEHLLSKGHLIAFIAVLAVIQLFVQLIFFMHLGQETKPHLNRIVMFSAIFVVVIVVFGSLWIMNHLDYNHGHMSPEETNTYIENEELIHR